MRIPASRFLARLGIAVSPSGYVQMGSGGEATEADVYEENRGHGLDGFKKDAAKNNRGRTKAERA